MAKLSDYIQRWALLRSARDLDFPSQGDPGEQGEQGEPGEDGDSLMLSATVNLTANQIKALHGTPITIVAAPGAGKAIAPIDGYGVFSAGVTPYTGAENIDLVWAGQEGEEDATLGLSLPSEVLEAEDDAVDRLTRSAPRIAAPADGNNKALVAHHENDDPTLGDGTLAITVFYVVADLA